MEGAPEATDAEEREWEEDGKEGGTQTLSEGLSDIGTSKLVPSAGGTTEGWRGSWLVREMEGLEERGEEVPDTDGGGAELYWGGGGEAHRSKRRREWDEAGWEQFEMEEEEQRETGSAVTTGEDNHGEIMEGGQGERGSDVVERNGGIGEMEGEVVDGGGDGAEIGGDNGTGGRPIAGRKPLRGRRRGKKKRKAQEEEKMANYMSRWLGNQDT